MMKWQEAIETIQPHIVQISTPQGSGTGFLLTKSTDSKTVSIATASHVINHASYWEEGIRIFHYASQKTVFLRAKDRVIFNNTKKDTASILFVNTKIPFPDEAIKLITEGKTLKIANEIGWLGFPAILGSTNLCLFSGRASAWLKKEEAYLVDGVAINGVSGGPSFFLPTKGGIVIIGIVSAYVPNRATGETLPGMCIIRDVSPFQETIRAVKNFDEAKRKEQKDSVKSYMKDNEEKGILAAYKSGKIKLSKPSKKEIMAIKVTAENTFKKDKRITIRLYGHDFNGIQKKAMEMGIPYQTLISGVVHRYIEGELIAKI